MSNEESPQEVLQLARASMKTTIVAYLWPEIATMKLLTTGDARFVPASHRYGEGYR